jgi:hypothetical protein
MKAVYRKLAWIVIPIKEGFMPKLGKIEQKLWLCALCVNVKWLKINFDE